MRSRFDDYPWPPFGRPRPAPFPRSVPLQRPEPRRVEPGRAEPRYVDPRDVDDTTPESDPRRVGGRYVEPVRSRPPSEPPPPVEVAPPAPSKADDSEEKLRRALDDLAAAEARVERNAQRVYEESRSKLALDLLPVLDNLDRSLQVADPADPIAQGVAMVRAQLEGVLLRYGVERVDAAGKAFDPAEHEAVLGLPVEDESQVGQVIEQVAPGYRLGTRLLRPARVQVGVKPEPATEPELLT